jgi:ribosomal protein S18 acetylase RimI-like enzyme
MAIRYTDNLAGITPDLLTGFFEGWCAPLTPERHLRLLKGSRHVVLAIDDSTGRVVGFINAVTDGTHSAFIPLLEVLRPYRGQGIGRNLVAEMLHRLREYPCIDLTCDPQLQPFYEKLGLMRSTGMILREPRPVAPPGLKQQKKKSILR